MTTSTIDLDPIIRECASKGLKLDKIVKKLQFSPFGEAILVEHADRILRETRQVSQEEFITALDFSELPNAVKDIMIKNRGKQVKTMP